MTYLAQHVRMLTKLICLALLFGGVVSFARGAELDDAEDKPATQERSPYYDIVSYIGKSNETKTIKVRPYPKWLEPPLPKGRDFSFELDTQGPGRGIYRLTSDEVQRIDCFELRMARQAAQRLGVSFD